jgi:hypothetical protein
VATTWIPPNVFEGMAPAVLAAVFAAIRETPHSPNKQSRGLPWVAAPLMEIGGRSEVDAKKIVASWIQNSVLIKGTHTNAHDNKVDCVTLNTTKADAIMAEVNAVNGPPE